MVKKQSPTSVLPLLLSLLLSVIAAPRLLGQTFPVEIDQLPQGKKIIITYKVIIQKPLDPRTTLSVADQISMTGENLLTRLSDDPDTSQPNDPTRTAVLGCSIQSIRATPPACGGNNRYSVDITVTSDGAPRTGDLVIEAGGQTFRAAVVPDTAVQTVRITLLANGQTIDVKAFYSDLPQCELTASALFTAPAGCGIIGDRVWEDLNGDGIQNDGATGIPDVVVVLLDCNDQPITQTLTNASGEYRFVQLPPGQYKLRFNFSAAGAVFAGAIPTIKNASADSLDSDINRATFETDCFTLGAGEQNLNKDAGVYVPAQLGDLAWVDRNRNNIFDSGDTPLAGVPVKLYRCGDTTTVLATQVTGANGRYLFTGLAPGSYWVRFGFPATGVYERVTPNVGSDLNDSDAEANGFTGCYTLQSRQQELSVDAGYTFCPPANSLACVSNISLTMGDNCRIELTAANFLTTPPPCLSTYEVRVRDSQGRNIGNVLTSAHVGQTLQATLIDLQTGVFCTSTVTVTDQRRPVITCPPNTNKARFAQEVQLFNGTLSSTDTSFNLASFSCFAPIVNPGGGNHFVNLYTFTVTEEDVYTFELSPTFGNGGALLFLGDKQLQGAICENVIAQSSVSFMNGVFFTNLNPITRIIAKLRPGQTYTLLTTSRMPAATGPFFWAAYSDRTGRIAGIQPINTQAQYDLICNDINQILNRPQSLALTGTPTATDNCTSPVTNITFTDQLTTGGDCNSDLITRTFTARDASGNSAQCTQLISVRKPTLADVVYPPLTVFLECSDDFTVDANGNPSPRFTGYPLVKTAFGNHELAPSYCNISATYADKPRIGACGSTYSLVRDWTIIDFCNPFNILIFSQVIRVGDSRPPMVSCPAPDNNNDGIPDTIVFSTSPFSCSATFNVPAPIISDNCSSSTFQAEVIADSIVPIFDRFGFVIDSQLQVVVRATVQSTGSLRVNNIPLGNHRLRYTVTDACGNRTVIECPIRVEDRIEPTVVCKTSLTISLGGEGKAKILARDIDEGSRDNCAIDSLLIRRRYVRNPVTCDSITPYFSEWDTFVDINCCDANSTVIVEMRVTDKAGNFNTCIAAVEVRDAIRPFCVAPAPVTIPCTSLPERFNPNDTTQLRTLFGAASTVDNCNARWEELAPVVNLSSCRTGAITRRFRSVDASGNNSVNTCQQVITVTPVNHYTIKFPKDTDIECGAPFADTLRFNNLGCDQLSVSITDEQFSSIGSECYRIFRTYRIINFCEYNGSAPPMIIGRDEDCDNNPGDEDVWVIRRPNNTFIDRNDVETDNVPAANIRGCSPTNPRGYWRTASSVGYWQYTQVIRVFDTTPPNVFFNAPQPFCSNNDNCIATAAIPFVVAELCTPGVVNLQAAVDLNNDGTSDGTLTNFTGGISGVYPNYEARGTFPLGKHALMLTIRDGCNNTGTVRIPFEIVDCRAPVPRCVVGGITVNLRPLRPARDIDGDGVEDPGFAVVRVTDLLGGPSTDCSGPVRYSIGRFGQRPDINRDSIIFTCNNANLSNVVEVYAWDSAANPYSVQPNGTVGGPNFGVCTAIVNVLDTQFGTCLPPKMGRVTGLIRTEAGKPVEGVRVSLSGQSAAVTHSLLDGTYAFADLDEGYDYTIAPLFDTLHQNGVNTVDLIIVTKHILGVEPLDSPFKMIAADVNNSKSVSILDLIQMRKLILGVDLKFPENTSWRFVRASYNFPVQGNPWFEEYPEVFSINDLEGTLGNANFIAIKIGDVNLTALTSLSPAVVAEPRSRCPAMKLQVKDRLLQAGEEHTIVVRADLSEVQGYQWTLGFAGLELLDIEYGRARAENFGFQAVERGLLTSSWHEVRVPQNVSDKNAHLFSLRVRAKAAGRLQDMLSVNSRITSAAAFDFADAPMEVALDFGVPAEPISTFELYQNLPNPFEQYTVIGFRLPEPTFVTLRIFDANGRTLKTFAGDYLAGQHQIKVEKSDLVASGVLYYTLESGQYTATRKMILLSK